MLDRSRKGEINPLFARVFLAEAYVGLDQLDKAREQAEEVLKIDPKFFLESEKRLTAFKDPFTENVVSRPCALAVSVRLCGYR